MPASAYTIIPAGALVRDIERLPEEPGVYLFLERAGSTALTQLGVQVSCLASTLFRGQRVVYVGCTRLSLRDRVKHHLRGSSTGSTLRMSLGAMLHHRLGLVAVGKPGQNYFGFGTGEGALTDWIGDNLDVAFRKSPSALEQEASLIRRHTPVLNLAKRVLTQDSIRLLEQRSSLSSRWVPRPPPSLLLCSERSAGSASQTCIRTQSGARGSTWRATDVTA